jgi:hypothetical protein
MSRLGGVVVSVLATGSKGYGFKTRPRRWILHFTITNINWLMLFKEIIPFQPKRKEREKKEKWGG